ncbi:3-keto-5-aminohexanoate cleavage protein [Streptomyces flavovirens]|uniref:3-keto-5-aminohexanoate cleavage protein n=1 Tax=Streptomyces flavovirens TaxID=52258 RepID=UPI0031EAB49D
MAAGAGSVHVHPRDEEGHESLDVHWVERAVRAVRQACPGLPVGVSTGLWMCGGDAAARRDTVLKWATAQDRPDFASVNLSEAGFEDLVEILTEMNVGVEAGVWSERDALTLLGGSHAHSCVRVLVELIDLPPAEALLRADRILDLLRRAGSTPPVLLHGEGVSTWPVLDKALALGLETRIGLEDTLTARTGIRWRTTMTWSASRCPVRPDPQAPGRVSGPVPAPELRNRQWTCPPPRCRGRRTGRTARRSPGRGGQRAPRIRWVSIRPPPVLPRRLRKGNAACGSRCCALHSGMSGTPRNALIL